MRKKVSDLFYAEPAKQAVKQRPGTVAMIAASITGSPDGFCLILAIVFLVQSLVHCHQPLLEMFVSEYISPSLKTVNDVNDEPSGFEIYTNPLQKGVIKIGHNFRFP